MRLLSSLRACISCGPFFVCNKRSARIPSSDDAAGPLVSAHAKSTRHLFSYTSPTGSCTTIITAARWPQVFDMTRPPTSGCLSNRPSKLLPTTHNRIHRRFPTTNKNRHLNERTMRLPFNNSWTVSLWWPSKRKHGASLPILPLTKLFTSMRALGISQWKNTIGIFEHGDCTKRQTRSRIKSPNTPCHVDWSHWKIVFDVWSQIKRLLQLQQHKRDFIALSRMLRSQHDPWA